MDYHPADGTIRPKSHNTFVWPDSRIGTNRWMIPESSPAQLQILDFHVYLKSGGVDSDGKSEKAR